MLLNHESEILIPPNENVRLWQAWAMVLSMTPSEPKANEKKVAIVYYISNEYNRNAGLTVDMCGLLVSIYITYITSLVRFSLLILEAARRLIREWQCRSI